MKIIKTPFDPRTTNEVDKQRLWFLMIESVEDDLPCINCGKETDERSVFAPQPEFRHIYGLDDVCEMQSIIYALCEKCKEFINELTVREKLKQINQQQEV